jgi:hypothetical protein
MRVQRYIAFSIFFDIPNIFLPGLQMSKSFLGSKNKNFLSNFQYLLRHYVIQHKFNEKWLTEALAERGIKYAPVRLRAGPGKPKELQTFSKQDEKISHVTVNYIVLIEKLEQKGGESIQ